MLLQGESGPCIRGPVTLPYSLFYSSPLLFALRRHWHVLDGDALRRQLGNTRTCISCLPRVRSACVDHVAGSSGGSAVPVAAKVVH